MAFAALGIGVAIVVCVGVFGICLAQLRCNDAAAELVRQAARSDLAAVQQIEDRLPSTAEVTLVTQGDTVVASVSQVLRPWGDWLPPVTIQAQASAILEVGGP